MPSITRRRIVGGGLAAVAGYGAYRLDRGGADAAFDAWTPAPGTWPLRRYDPANTAHNPNATPPRGSPSVREVVATATDARRPRFRPVVGPDHVALYGSGLAAYPHGGGSAVLTADAAAPLAGFGPGGRLHAVRHEPDAADGPPAVVGYDGTDRHEAYRFPLGDDATGLTVGAGEAYVGTEGGTLHAIAPDGGRRWRVDGALPALADGVLYVADTPLDGTVAYARRTGVDRLLAAGPERIWRTGSDPVRGFPYPPAVADGRVVQGARAAGGGAVVAFDAGSGDRLWGPRPLGTDVSTPAVVGDRGYVAAGTDGPVAGRVVALDLATGETRWRDEVAHPAVAPAAGGDTLVVAGAVREDGERAGGWVRAYDRHAGDVLWRRRLGSEPGGLALVGDRILVTAGGSLYELG
ncbi:MAG: PQQ-binding-like beta-propeller repeat protein [Haloferacaceae archaeon]